MLNVKSFGAVGDGKSNDLYALRAAVNAAMLAGETIYFPQGTYRLIPDIAFVGTPRLKPICATIKKLFRP